MNEPLPPDRPAEPIAGAPAPLNGVAAPAGTAPGWERSTMERLLFATLEEQKAARRWRAFVRLAWLAFFIFLVWALSYRNTPSDKLTPHTAVISIDGEIGPKTDASADAVLAAAKAAFEDEGTRGVVLLINSPGGSPVQAGIINDELRRMKEKYKKPLYVVVEESCASAAYYIAVAADRIYVDKASIVGSIGVLMEGFGFVGLMDKLGIERRLLTAGENKGFLDPFSPQTDKQKEHAQQMLDVVHRQFIDVVKAGRGKRLKADTPGLFSGLFWTGQQAVDLGLADQLGNLDYVAREVIKAEDLVDYTQRENVAEKLARRFGAAIGEGAVKAMQKLPALR
ncbi:S49 family peptidase [Ramlibacter ginsenosidimutans]|uniref:S49 family peptidase n=1 Tax=Ramlibacter ginsenosidimutans TaxID=502333 RepID=A0A934TT51_9BURK|nr:S49 family peptidase [Ramlibacter ginsenosidimutans]MBK6006939.1 S49 family peptidase [Ramlibacter ginsenosidimutans]